MKPIWIAGTGSVSPLGVGISFSPSDSADPNGPRLVPGDLPLKDDFPRAAVRWLDGASLWWAHAVMQASAGASEETLASMGQFSGQTWGPTQPVIDLERTLLDEGFGAMNPATFPFSVGNAPAAQASLLVRVGGPAVTLNGKEACGLAAIVEACRFIASDRLTSCVAGGADQLAPFLMKLLRALRRHGALPSGEGAYALRLESEPDRSTEALAKITGWASLATPCPAHLYPSDPRALFDRLLEKTAGMAGLETGEIEKVALPEDTGELAAAASAWRSERLPRAEQIHFQRTLGVCGAAWAGAAAVAARGLREDGGGPVLLIALATGGAGCGLLVEDARA